MNTTVCPLRMMAAWIAGRSVKDDDEDVLCLGRACQWWLRGAILIQGHPAEGCALRFLPLIGAGEVPG